MQVIVDHLGTEYKDSGKGKVVLFLHGWGDSQETFKQLRSDLRGQYRVVSLDLPGFGKTEPPRLAWDLDDYAQFVAEFLKKKKIDKTYAIIGHSNGGAIAIRGLSKGYLQAERLVLLASAGVRLRQQKRKLVLKAIAKTGKVVSRPLPESTRDKLRTKLYDVAQSDMLKVRHMEETFRKTVSHDVQADAAKLQVPTLLIYGEQDQDTPPIIGEIFHNKFPNATFEVIGEAGHFIHLEQPEYVYASVKRFLR